MRWWCIHYLVRAILFLFDFFVSCLFHDSSFFCHFVVVVVVLIFVLGMEPLVEHAIAIGNALTLRRLLNNVGSTRFFVNIGATLCAISITGSTTTTNSCLLCLSSASFSSCLLTLMIFGGFRVFWF